MTFNLFSITRKKRSLMYGRVARPIQKSFFKFCGDFFKAEWITFPIMLSHSFFLFFFRYSGVIKQYLLISFVSKNTTNFFHFLQITS